MSVSSFPKNSQGLHSPAEDDVFLFGTQAAGAIEEWQMEKENKDINKERTMSLRRFTFDDDNRNIMSEKQNTSNSSSNSKKSSKKRSSSLEEGTKKATKKIARKKDKSEVDDSNSPTTSLDVFSLLSSKKNKVKQVTKMAKLQDQSSVMRKNKQKKDKVLTKLANLVYSEDDWKKVRHSLISRYLNPTRKSQITLNSVLERQEKIINSHPTDSISYNSIKLPADFEREDFKALYDLQDEMFPRGFLDHSQDSEIDGIEKNSSHEKESNDELLKSQIANDSSQESVECISDSESESLELNDQNIENMCKLSKILVESKRNLPDNTNSSLDKDNQDFDFDFIDSIQNEPLKSKNESLEISQFVDYDINDNRNDSSILRDLDNLTKGVESDTDVQETGKEGGHTQEDPVLIISSSQDNDQIIDTIKRPREQTTSSGLTRSGYKKTFNAIQTSKEDKIQVLESVYQNSAQLTSFKLNQKNSDHESHVDANKKPNFNISPDDKIDTPISTVKQVTGRNIHDSEIEIIDESDNGYQLDEDASLIVEDSQISQADQKQERKSFEIINTSSPILKPDDEIDDSYRALPETLKSVFSTAENDETDEPLSINQLPNLIRSSTVEQGNILAGPSTIVGKNSDKAILVDEILNSSLDSDNEDDDLSLENIIKDLSKGVQHKKPEKGTKYEDISLPDSVDDEEHNISLIQVLSSQDNSLTERTMTNDDDNHLISTQKPEQLDEPEIILHDADNTDFGSVSIFDFSSRREKISGLATFQNSHHDNEDTRGITADETEVQENIMVTSGSVLANIDPEEEDLQSQLNFESYSTAQLKSQMNEWGLKPAKSRQAMISVLKTTSSLIDKEFLRQSISQRDSQSQGDSQCAANNSNGFLLKFSQAQLTENESNYKKEKESAALVQKTRFNKVREILRNDRETYLKIILFQPLNLSSVLYLINEKNNLNIDQPMVCEILTGLGVCYTETDIKMTQSQGMTPGNDIDDMELHEESENDETGLD